MTPAPPRHYKIPSEFVSANIALIVCDDDEMAADATRRNGGKTHFNVSAIYLSRRVVARYLLAFSLLSGRQMIYIYMCTYMFTHMQDKHGLCLGCTMLRSDVIFLVHIFYYYPPTSIMKKSISKNSRAIYAIISWMCTMCD